MKAELLSGAGNLFALVDGRGGDAPDGGGAARWCEAALHVGDQAADGLLVLLESEVATARLVIWNSDGSEAAACGNGLRCAGWYLLREEGAEEVLIETVTGTRAVRGEAWETGASELVAELGEVKVEPITEGLDLLEGERAAWRGDVGNPHCVFLVDDVRAPGFEARGAALQTDAAFPDGVNVGYLAEGADGWKLRVFERGVGETGACGTGAAAAAAVLQAALGLTLPVTLALPAGRLKIARGPDLGLSVAGGVERLGALCLSATSLS